MKHIIFLFFFYFTSILLQAQDCPTINAIFDTQEEVDNFPTLYPDCDSISGSVILSTGVYNTDSLYQIRIIEGDISSSFNNSIISVNGFDQLERLGGSIVLNSNTVLEEVIGFPNLKKIGGELSIRFNQDLILIQGFEQLDSISSAVTIKSNPSLNNLSTFNTLKFIDGDVSLNSLGIMDLSSFEQLNTINGVFEISNLYELEMLPSFDALDHVGGLDIQFNDKLNSLNSFNNLEETESIYITNNDTLNLLGGFNTLDSATVLNIEENPNLIEVSGFPELKKLFSFKLGYHDSLTTVNGLGQIQSVESFFLILSNPLLSDISFCLQLNTLGWLYIVDNTSINSLEPLNQIDTIFNEFWLIDMPQVNTLGMNSLKTVEGILLKGNQNLQSIDGLGSLTQIENFTIEENPSFHSFEGINEDLHFILRLEILKNQSLIDLNGLHNLDSLFLLRTEENPNLLELTGMEGLDYLNVLSLKENQNLQDISALSNLSIVEKIRLEDLPTLNSITALENILPSRIEEIRIQECFSLSDCAIESFCEYLEEDGTADLQNNGGNCNSEEEILEDCQNVSNTNFVEEQEFSFSPNPSNGIINFEYKDQSIFQIEVFNTLGEKVFSKLINTNQIDLSFLPKGVYFIQLQNDYFNTINQVVLN